MTALPETTFRALLGSVAAKTPTPGGGAVAAAVGALAGALANMVVAYSIGKKSLAEHSPKLEGAAASLARAREVLLELAAEDAAAYEALSRLMKLPEGDPVRREQWGATVHLALDAPRATAAACCDLLRLMESLAPITNRNLRSDLAIAAVLADAAARASRWNVAVNLSLLTDMQDRSQISQDLDRMLAEGAAVRERVEQACR